MSVIGDWETVTGFLLTGIGQKDLSGQYNFLIVEDETTAEEIESAFDWFVKDPKISIVLINQKIAKKYLQ